MTEPTITKTIFLDATPHVVWSFLTEKDKLAKWFHPAENDLAEGEDYALLSSGDDGEPSKLCWGKVLEMDKPKKLVYSFTVKPIDIDFTTVTWTLEEAFGGTKLTMVHEGIVDKTGAVALQGIYGFDKGWDQHLLKLRDVMG